MTETDQKVDKAEVGLIILHATNQDHVPQWIKLGPDIKGGGLTALCSI